MKMKKIYMKMMASVMVLGLLVGCGTSAKQSSKVEVKEPAKVEVKEPTKNSPIIVYSNSAGDGRGEWLTEKAKEAGFEINIVSGGGGDIANRLIAEKNNPIADVVYGLATMNYEKFKQDNLLYKYVPTWAGEIPQGLNDSEGFYHGIVLQPLALIYNQDTYTAETAPKDWTDVATRPEFKDKYNVMGLGGGTSRVILASILTRYKDEKGEYGISDEGWKMAKNYIQNAHMTVEGEDWFGNLVSGDVPMTMIWGSGILQFQKEHNIKVGVVSPEVGVPHLVEQVAIIEGSKNIETAKAFVDWFGGPEIQGQWSEKFGSAPAHPAALEKAPQEVKDLIASVKKQPMDWAFIMNNIDKWVEKVELEFME